MIQAPKRRGRPPKIKNVEPNIVGGGQKTKKTETRGRKSKAYHAAKSANLFAKSLVNNSPSTQQHSIGTTPNLTEKMISSTPIQA